MLFKVDLFEEDKNLFLSYLKKNDSMLKALNIDKKDLSIELIDTVKEVLSYKDCHRS